MKENDLPNYYSVIPAKVRYCPDLSFFEIVLYSEISALTNAFGYCFASNNYFGTLYKKDCAVISRAIKKLVDFGFIWLEIAKEEGNKRKIYITPIDVGVNTPIDVGVNSPIDVGVNHNNTSNNNINLNKTARATDSESASYLKDLFKEACLRTRQKNYSKNLH